MKAFVLIKARPGMEDRLMELVCEDSRVRSAYITFGPYDIVCEIIVKDTNELEEVVRYIRKLPDVDDTITLIVARASIQERS